MKKTTFLFQGLFIVAFLVFGFNGHGQIGTLCTNPIIVPGLPYQTTDHTVNYADNYDPPTATSIACGSGTAGNYYLSGNDVIYTYTPAGSGTINLQIPSAPGWSGLFVFTSCAGIGSAPYGCNCSSAAGNRTINNLSVVAGQTYFIVVSSWGSQLATYPYTLNITGTLENEDFTAATINAYPNPVKDYLQISNPDQTISRVMVYNLFGQEIISEDWTGKNNTSLDMTKLASGTYLLSVTTDGKTATRKIIKM